LFLNLTTELQTASHSYTLKRDDKHQQVHRQVCINSGNGNDLTEKFIATQPKYVKINMPFLSVNVNVSITHLNLR